MSRSEQTQDSSMDEILASIRKIISDDEPEAPDADIMNAALVDFPRTAAARAPESYMGDLTRALASDPAPRVSDDDIFDEAPPAPGYARRMSDVLAEAIRAPQMPPAQVPAAAPESSDDDADLFEAGAAPAEVPEEPVAALEFAAEALVEDEDFIAELDDPISLGPEIELVDEVADASSPDQTRTADTAIAPPVVAEIPAAPPALSATLAPPPPPPPPVALEAGSDVDVPPPVEAATPVEAKAPIEPVPPVQPEPPAEPSVAEIVVAPEPPATVETMDVAPLAGVAAEAVEAAPASLPEIAPPAVASISADEPSASDEVPAEVVASDEASSATGTPQAVAVPPLAAAPAVSEDVMAQLLKPMLKEWLDANMPRIVAKAMGEGGKPDGDTSPAS